MSMDDEIRVGQMNTREENGENDIMSLLEESLSNYGRELAAVNNTPDNGQKKTVVINNKPDSGQTKTIAIYDKPDSGQAKTIAINNAPANIRKQEKGNTSMSMDDEIKAEKMKLEKRKAAIESEQRLEEELKQHCFDRKSPTLSYPSDDIKAIISEAVRMLDFNIPFVFYATRGLIYVRQAHSGEKPDAYGVEIELLYRGLDSYDSQKYDYLWILDNGRISFFNYSSHYGHTKLFRPDDITADIIRKKIVEYAAKQRFDAENKPDESSEDGCYIATSVYGSYDCPEVWVLRRFRDFSLKKTALGRLFIRIYYTVSPRMVKRWGKKEWFTIRWRKFLNRLVAKLKGAGFSDARYDDPDY